MNSNDFKNIINESLENYFKNKGNFNKKIYEAMEYSILVGGKRIRPILLLLSYNMYEKDYKKALDMAMAIEFIHTYSLIHDDLPCMDNDDLRRGLPTNHKKFGEDIAVLAGDGLLNEAFELMIKNCLKGGKETLLATKVLTEAAGVEGMIGGQVVDIINEGKKISIEELEYMHLKKTGELIRASLVAGALLANAPSEDIEKLDLYGRKLGLAFQIKDDILDLIGDVVKLGKNTKSDENNNKTNFLTVYGMEKCEELCKTLTDECISLLDSLNKDATPLKELTLSLLDREF